MRKAPKHSSFSPTRDVVPGANGYVGRIFGDLRIRRVERATEQLALYLADDLTPAPRRHVLLKVLRRPGLDDPTFAKSFEAEAELALRLHHEHILRAFARPEIDGFPSVAFEAPDGPRLSQLLQRVRGRGVGLPFEAVCTIGVQILQGLEHAHAQKNLDGRPLVHQAVCPDNVYLNARGRVQLAHFAGRGLDAMSDLGARLPYLAPEQINATACPASDQYGVAVLIVELLTGRRLFEAASARDLAQAIVDRDRPPMARLLPFKSTALEVALERALSVDPRDRFPNVAALAKALDRALAQGGRRVSEASVAGVLSEGQQGALGGAADNPVQDRLQRHRIGAQPLTLSDDGARERAASNTELSDPGPSAEQTDDRPAGRSWLKGLGYLVALLGTAAAAWAAGQSFGLMGL